MKAQKVVSVILALTLMMSMVPAAFAVELENPNDIFSEEYFAYVAKEDGNPYVDGDYVTRGRSGLLIHGGRDQTSLWNTEGCVRIFDKDAKKITGLMDSWRSAGYHQFGRIKITRPGQSL